MNSAAQGNQTSLIDQIGLLPAGGNLKAAHADLPLSGQNHDEDKVLAERSVAGYRRQTSPGSLIRSSLCKRID